MSEFWYYAADNETRGPIALDQLVKLLSLMPSSRGVLVWREGFDEWEAAENVREIAEKLIRPPPLPRSSVTAPSVTEKTPRDAVVDQEGLDAVARSQQQFRKVKPAEALDHNKYYNEPTAGNVNTRGRIAFLVVFMLVLLTGAYFTSQIYGNSYGGIAELTGELIGAWFLLTALAWRIRKSAYTAAVVLAVAAFSVAIHNIGKLQESIAGHEARASLQGITDPKQVDLALSRNPSNKLLRLIATAMKAAEETNALTTKLSDEIEPPSVSKDIDFATASLNDLEVLRRDVKTAEDNATAFMPRYLALLKAERDKVESFALSLQMEKGTVSAFLTGMDERHTKFAAFNSKMMLARTDFYRAFGNYLTVLIGEFGNYKVINGQFIFPRQPTADRYNVVATAMTAAAKRIADLEVEGKAVAQSQQEGWERFVKDK